MQDATQPNDQSAKKKLNPYLMADLCQTPKKLCILAN